MNKQRKRARKLQRQMIRRSNAHNTSVEQEQMEAFRRGELTETELRKLNYSQTKPAQERHVFDNVDEIAVEINGFTPNEVIVSADGDVEIVATEVDNTEEGDDSEEDDDSEDDDSEDDDSEEDNHAKSINAAKNDAHGPEPPIMSNGQRAPGKASPKSSNDNRTGKAPQTTPVKAPDYPLNIPRSKQTPAEKFKRQPTPTRPPVYVLDTNLLISCVDVLYDPNNPNWREPLDFYPALDNAILVIPNVVRKELCGIKNDRENPLRAFSARIALERLANFLQNSGRSIGEVLTLRQTVPTGWKNQKIAVLPLPPGFARSLPIRPVNNDDQIAATALAATLLYDGQMDSKGKVRCDLLKCRSNSKFVTLLTNDRDIRSSAEQYAVRVSTYRFTERPPFTGCRELVVPPAMFEQFYFEHALSREDFEYFMPDEPSLLANEYVIMTPKNDEYPAGYFAVQDITKSVARFNKAHQCLYPLRFVKYEGVTPPNIGIAIYYDAMNDDSIRVVFVTGEAGTGKTYQAIMHGLKCIQEGKYSKLILITTTSAVNPLGSLPGGVSEKEAPLVALVKDAIRYFLANTPEFKRKRAELRKFRLDPSEGSAEDVNSNGRRSGSRSSDRRSDNRSNSYAGNHLGSYADSRSNDSSGRNNRASSRRLLINFEYTSDIDEGYNEDLSDVRAEDFGEPHGRKKGKSKSKTFYPGKNSTEDPHEKKMSYNDLLDKQVEYIYRNHCECLPYEQAQGRSLHDAVIVIDEIQRAKLSHIDTDLTRAAEDSLLIICGDLNQLPQNDAEHRYRNPLTYSQLGFFDEECAAHVHLTENMRGTVAKTFTANRDKIRRLLGMS